MPAEIVVVFSDWDFAGEVASRLRDAGHDATSLPGPMQALDALEGAVRIELLITCLDFGPNKPNGIALARMARHKRSGIKVLFVGDESLRHHAEGLGAFLASPVAVDDVVAEVQRLREAESE